MSSGYKYFTGEYFNYYNELGNNGLSAKANDLRSNVDLISTQFENVQYAIGSLSGEGISAMTTDAVSSIMNKFSVTKENIDSSLLPAVEAMELLVEKLELMKEKEDLLIKKEEALLIENSRNVPESIASGTDKDGKTIYKHNSEYDIWLDTIKKLEEEILLLKEELDKIKLECDEAIKKIKLLEGKLKEFSDFYVIASSTLGLDGGAPVDFSAMSLEERLSYLNEILNNYKQIKEQMDQYYEKMYGRGFSFSNEDFQNMFMLFDAFDLFYKSGTDIDEFKGLPMENGNVLLKIDALMKVMSYCETTGAIDKITSYLNGESWEESGLATLYEQDGLFGYNENRFNRRMKTFYGMKNPREELKARLDGILASWNNLESSYAEFQVTRQAISTIQQKIDNFEMAMNLLPYEIHTEDDLYIKKYKGVKFGSIDGLGELYNKHMTDDEKALYKYLCDTKGVDYANQYLELMEDPMNMREGMARAKEYVEWIGKDGFQVADVVNGGLEGFKDGVRNFFDGLGDLFRVADTKAGTKSALDYELMFKAQYMLDAADSLGIDIDPNLRALINQAYQTGNTVGTMAVPMIAGAIPGIGQTLSTVLMTASFSGNAAVEGRQNGLGVGAAYLYGALSGGSEAILEKTLGAVPFIGDLSGSLLKDIGSEMIEEGVQTILDAGLNKVFFDENITFTELYGNVKESMKQAAISTPFMQGFGKVVVGPAVGNVSKIAVNTFTGGNYSVGDVYQLADNKVSSFFMGKADAALQTGIDVVNNDGKVSFLDKLFLDKAVSDVSVEELATVTSNMSQEGLSKLTDSGLLSAKSTAKLKLADTFSKISSQTSESLDVSGLTKGDLSATVTRDGQSLSEYIANNKADSITESTMSDLRDISAKEARVVNKTIKENVSMLQKQQRTAELKDTVSSFVKKTLHIDNGSTNVVSNSSATPATVQNASSSSVVSSNQTLNGSQMGSVVDNGRLSNSTPSVSNAFVTQQRLSDDASVMSQSTTNTSSVSSVTPSVTSDVNVAQQNSFADSSVVSQTSDSIVTNQSDSSPSIDTVSTASAIGVAGGLGAMMMTGGITPNSMSNNSSTSTNSPSNVSGQTRTVGKTDTLFNESSNTGTNSQMIRGIYSTSGTSVDSFNADGSSNSVNGQANVVDSSKSTVSDGSQVITSKEENPNSHDANDIVDVDKIKSMILTITDNESIANIIENLTISERVYLISNFEEMLEQSLREELTKLGVLDASGNIVEGVDINSLDITKKFMKVQEFVENNQPLLFTHDEVISLDFEKYKDNKNFLLYLNDCYDIPLEIKPYFMMNAKELVYLIDNGKINPNMITADNLFERVPEFVEISTLSDRILDYIKEKNDTLFNAILERAKVDGEIAKVFVRTGQREIADMYNMEVENENGVKMTLLDYAGKGHSYLFSEIAKDNVFVASKLLENETDYFLTDVSVEFLKETVVINGYETTVLDYIFDTNIYEKYGSMFTTYATKDADVAKKLLMKNSFSFVTKAKENVLLSKFDSNRTLYDYIMEKCDVNQLHKMGLLGKNEILTFDLLGSVVSSSYESSYFISNRLEKMGLIPSSFYHDALSSASNLRKILEIKDWKNHYTEKEITFVETLLALKKASIQNKFLVFVQENFESISIGQIEQIGEVFTRIESSNSSELNRIGDEVVELLLYNPSNMVEQFSKIEDIFVKNNLPIVGKIYKVFETLHPNFSGFNFSGNNRMSPILKQESAGYHNSLYRKVVVFSDLIKSFFGSNNRSVNDYLNNIEVATSIYEDINNKSRTLESLNSEELEELNIFRQHLITMYNNTLLKDIKGDEFVSTNDLIGDINDLVLKLSPDGTTSYNLADRIVSMFTGNVGINTLDDAKNYIKSKIDLAHSRNVAASDVPFTLEKGDLIKGLGDIKYLRNILQNGSVSKEYLGSSADSDATPLDTDLSMIQSDSGSFKEKLSEVAANGYGPIYVVLKNDERFITTRTVYGESKESYGMNDALSKMELFYTGALGKDHYGIRTGFASSEINYFLMERYDDRVGLEIASNGFYIPVVDMDGNLLFTPDDYNMLRSKMNGLTYYGETNYSISDNLVNTTTTEIVERLTENERQVSEKRNKIIDVVSSVLDSFGLKLEHKIGDNLTNGIVEFIDTGSTGRGTNKPGDGDFDFMMKLDRDVIYNPEKINLLKQSFLEKFGADSSGVIGSGDFRLKGVKIDSETVVDIDITFVPKTDRVAYSTDMAVRDRLQNIKEQYPDKYNYVVANILQAKLVLQEGGVYKPARSDANQGGLGGVGVENWILQNGGSFIDAARSFIAATVDENGNKLSFEEFAKAYPIWDFGDNHMAPIKDIYPHDNFVMNMKLGSVCGYEKMKRVLSDFLDKIDSDVMAQDSMDVNNMSQISDNVIFKNDTLENNSGAFSQISDSIMTNQSDSSPSIDSVSTASTIGLAGGLGAMMTGGITPNTMINDSSASTSSLSNVSGQTRTVGKTDTLFNESSNTGTNSQMARGIYSTSGTSVETFNAGSPIHVNDNADSSNSEFVSSYNKFKSIVDKKDIIGFRNVILDSTYQLDVMQDILNNMSERDYRSLYKMFNDASFEKGSYKGTAGNGVVVFKGKTLNGKFGTLYNYFVFDNVTERCYSIFTETDIINSKFNDKQVVGWLNSDRLTTKNNELFGYVGYLGENGNVYKDPKWVESFTRHKMLTKSEYSLYRNLRNSLNENDINLFVSVVSHSDYKEMFDVYKYLSNSERNSFDKALRQSNFKRQYYSRSDGSSIVVFDTSSSTNINGKTLNKYFVLDSKDGKVYPIITETKIFDSKYSNSDITNWLSNDRLVEKNDSLGYIERLEKKRNYIRTNYTPTELQSLRDFEYIISSFYQESTNNSLVQAVNDFRNFVTSKKTSNNKFLNDFMVKHTQQEIFDLCDTLVRMENVSQNVEKYVRRAIIDFNLKHAQDQYYLGGEAAVQKAINTKNFDDFGYQLITSALLSALPLDEIQLALNKIILQNNLNSINVSGINRTSDEFFEKYGSSKTDDYGTDQGSIYNLFNFFDSITGDKYDYRQAKKIVNSMMKNGQQSLRSFDKKCDAEYFALKAKVMNKLPGLTEKEASVILSSVDDAGACTYAAFANQIFNMFKNDAKRFKDVFGFSMYRIKDGVRVLNSEELLVDLYVFGNMRENGGNFIVKDDKGYHLDTQFLSVNVDPLGRNLLDADKQVYYDKLNLREKYFNSKGLTYKIKNTLRSTSSMVSSRDKLDGFIEFVRNEMKKGNSFDINIYNANVLKSWNGFTKSIRMISPSSDYPSVSTAQFRGGHAVFITDITENEFIVSSWGRKYMIPFDDLFESCWLVNFVENDLSTHLSSALVDGDNVLQTVDSLIPEHSVDSPVIDSVSTASTIGGLGAMMTGDITPNAMINDSFASTSSLSNVSGQTRTVGKTDTLFNESSNTGTNSQMARGIYSTSGTSVETFNAESPININDNADSSNSEFVSSYNKFKSIIDKRDIIGFRNAILDSTYQLDIMQDILNNMSEHDYRSLYKMFNDASFEKGSYKGTAGNGVVVFKGKTLNGKFGTLYNYFVFDNVTERCYSIFTETDIINSKFNDKQVVGWLNSDRLTTKNNELFGYVGYLSENGSIRKNPDLVNYFTKQKMLTKAEYSLYRNLRNSLNENDINLFVSVVSHSDYKEMFDVYKYLSNSERTSFLNALKQSYLKRQYYSRKDGSAIVVFDASSTTNINGKTLNKYFVLDSKDGKVYPIITETKIFDLKYSNSDITNWLNNDRLFEKNSDFMGYVGYLSENGKVYKNQDVLNFVAQYVMSSKNSTAEFFEKYGNPNNGNYGVAQGCLYEMMKFMNTKTGQSYSYREIIGKYNEDKRRNKQDVPSFVKICTREYFEIKESIMKKYGFNATDASNIFTCINDLGACAYASVCNQIFDYFKNDPKTFEKIFGYPMYKLENGVKKVLNAEKLLIDLYIFTNDIDNGGEFFYKDSSGRYHLSYKAFGNKVDPLNRPLLNTKKQASLSGSNGIEPIVAKFFSSKGLFYEPKLLIKCGSYMDNKKMNDTLQHVIEGIKNGQRYSLGIYKSKSTIHMIAPADVNYNSMSTSTWDEGSGHAVFVTDIDSNGFIVSSWGRKFTIPFNDLINGGRWILNEITISDKPISLSMGNFSSDKTGIVNHRMADGSSGVLNKAMQNFNDSSIEQRIFVDDNVSVSTSQSSTSGALSTQQNSLTDSSVVSQTSDSIVTNQSDSSSSIDSVSTASAIGVAGGLGAMMMTGGITPNTMSNNSSTSTNSPSNVSGQTRTVGNTDTLFNESYNTETNSQMHSILDTSVEVNDQLIMSNDIVSDTVVSDSSIFETTGMIGKTNTVFGAYTNTGNSPFSRNVYSTPNNSMNPLYAAAYMNVRNYVSTDTKASSFDTAAAYRDFISILTGKDINSFSEIISNSDISKLQDIFSYMSTSDFISLYNMFRDSSFKGKSYNVFNKNSLVIFKGGIINNGFGNLYNYFVFDNATGRCYPIMTETDIFSLSLKDNQVRSWLNSDRLLRKTDELFGYVGYLNDKGSFYNDPKIVEYLTRKKMLTNSEYDLYRNLRQAFYENNQYLFDMRICYSDYKELFKVFEYLSDTEKTSFVNLLHQSDYLRESYSRADGSNITVFNISNIDKIGDKFFNRYFVLDSKDGKVYPVITETDILGSDSNYIAKWLSNYNLSVNNADYMGYAGYLADDGFYYKNFEVLDYFSPNPASVNLSTAEFFDKYGDFYNNAYGVDQGCLYNMMDFIDSNGNRLSYRDAIEVCEEAKKNGIPIPSFEKKATLEYFEIKESIMKKYGFTSDEASKILTCIDNTGACSYASICNQIFDYFKNDPRGFERIFGYPMYKTGQDVKNVLNAEKLLVDLYIFANDMANGGKFIFKDSFGKYHLNPLLLSANVDPLDRPLLDTEKQVYMSSSSGIKDSLINEFLKDKGITYSSSVLIPCGSIVNSKMMDDTVQHVIEGIKNGHSYSLGIYSSGSTINMIAPNDVNYSSESTSTWREGGGHAVFVTGIDPNGFVVSSWGRKYVIPFKDLRKSGRWILNEVTISDSSISITNSSSDGGNIGVLQGQVHDGSTEIFDGHVQVNENEFNSLESSSDTLEKSDMKISQEMIKEYIENDFDNFLKLDEKTLLYHRNYIANYFFKADWGIQYLPEVLKFNPDVLTILLENYNLKLLGNNIANNSVVSNFLIENVDRVAESIRANRINFVVFSRLPVELQNSEKIIDACIDSGNISLLSSSKNSSYIVMQEDRIIEQLKNGDVNTMFSLIDLPIKLRGSTKLIDAILDYGGDIFCLSGVTNIEFLMQRKSALIDLIRKNNDFNMYDIPQDLLNDYDFVDAITDVKRYFHVDFNGKNSELFEQVIVNKIKKGININQELLKFCKKSPKLANALLQNGNFDTLNLFDSTILTPENVDLIVTEVERKNRYSNLEKFPDYIRNSSEVVSLLIKRREMDAIIGATSDAIKKCRETIITELKNGAFFGRHVSSIKEEFKNDREVVSLLVSNGDLHMLDYSDPQIVLENKLGIVEAVKNGHEFYISSSMPEEIRSSTEIVGALLNNRNIKCIQCAMDEAFDEKNIKSFAEIISNTRNEVFLSQLMGKFSEYPLIVRNSPEIVYSILEKKSINGFVSENNLSYVLNGITSEFIEKNISEFLNHINSSELLSNGGLLELATSMSKFDLSEKTELLLWQLIINNDIGGYHRYLYIPANIVNKLQIEIVESIKNGLRPGYLIGLDYITPEIKRIPAFLDLALETMPLNNIFSDPILCELITEEQIMSYIDKNIASLSLYSFPERYRSSPKFLEYLAEKGEINFIFSCNQEALTDKAISLVADRIREISPLPLDGNLYDNFDYMSWDSIIAKSSEILKALIDGKNYNMIRRFNKEAYTKEITSKLIDEIINGNFTNYYSLIGKFDDTSFNDEIVEKIIDSFSSGNLKILAVLPESVAERYKEKFFAKFPYDEILKRVHENDFSFSSLKSFMLDSAELIKNFIDRGEYFSFVDFSLHKESIRANINYFALKIASGEIKLDPNVHLAANYEFLSSPKVVESLIITGNLEMMRKVSPDALTNNNINLFVEQLRRGVKISPLVNFPEVIRNNEVVIETLIQTGNVSLLSGLPIEFYYQHAEQISNSLRISKESYIEKLDKLCSINDEVFSTLNLEMLSDKFSDLSLEFVERCALYTDIQKMIIQMSTSSQKLELFIKFADILQSKVSELDFNGVVYRILKNGMSQNSEFITLLNNIDVKLLSDEQIIRLMKVLQNSCNLYSIDTMDDLILDNYIAKRNAYLDNMRLKVENGILSLDEMKQLLSTKLFDLDYELIEFINNRYNFDINALENLDDEVEKTKLSEIIEFLKAVNSIITTDDMDILKNIYLNVDIVLNNNLLDNFAIEEQIRSKYSELFNDTLYVPQDKHLSTEKLLTNVRYRGNDIKVYQVEGDFRMQIHSLGAYREFEVPENFKTAWLRPKIAFHGICTSYISNDSISPAYIGHPVLGFSEYENSSLLLSGNYDLFSDYSIERFETSMSCPYTFLPPSIMINYTRHNHNEMVIERRKNINGKISKRLPNYVVYFVEDLSESNFSDTNSLWNETKQAASDFGVPIVVINRSQFLKSEMEACKKLEEEFFNTKSIVSLRKAMTKYINNSVGCRFLDSTMKKGLTAFSPKVTIDFYERVLQNVEQLIKNNSIEEASDIVDELFNIIERERKAISVSHKSDKLEKTFDYDNERKRLEDLKNRLVK